MGEPGRIQVWWSRLPRAWRVNVTLYLLACLSLFALVVQVLTEEGPRQVEVAADGSRRTPTTRVTVTTEPPTTTVSTTPGTTVALTPEAVPTTGPRAPSLPAVGFDPSAAVTVPCRNSTNPECGTFFFDPLPRNEPLSVQVEIASYSPIPGGQRVTFRVTVTDPDHAVTGNCSIADFGDGARESLPCAPSPPCPPMYGPWDPPPPQRGSGTFSFTHDYVARPDSYTARFSFRTDRDRCRDPYGSASTAAFSVSVPSEGT